jgi:hypothetical protein
MAAVLPEEKPAFYSMITGSVDELYAYNHHFKWWRDAKTEQFERRAQREAAFAAAAPVAAAGGKGPRETPPAARNA